MRFAGDQALGVGDAGEPGDAAHRPQEVYQTGQGVGSHVEHRAAAALVEEGGVGMPALGTGAGHEGNRVQGGADPAVVEQLATGLMAAAEEGVRRAAQQHPGGRGGAHQIFALDALHRQRLLAPHVLAGSDGGARHGVVGGGDGEVDHQLDGSVGEQFLRGQHARNTELVGLRPGPLRQQVGTGHHLQERKLPAPLEVVPADFPAADHPNPHLVHGPTL